jgi:dihydrofolate reductase
MAIQCSVFCATSLDGFIARKSGAFDFLPPPVSDTGEDHGFDAFMATVDTVVLGRNTFEVVLGMGDAWFYPKPVLVLTHRPLELPERLRDKVEIGTGTPAEIVALMEKRGARRLYVDGGLTIQAFLRAGLIDDLTISQIPVLIGEGIRLFGAVETDVKLTVESTRLLAKTVLQTTWRVVR